MAVTMFLGVLIVSLIFGNVLLFFVGSAKPRQVIEEAEPEVLVIQPQQTVNLMPLEKKVELAHKRIQIIEHQLESSTSQGVSPSFKRKVELLDNFRSTVEAEIIGIKEILAEIQDNNITVKSRSFRGNGKNKPKKLSPKELHAMVYRSKA
ncbi:MAG: hypothetical protein NUV57_06220 [archaeon]|nr:hypothetical protein [archaeon]